MKNQVKNFSQFINESRRYEDINEFVKNPDNYSDDWDSYSNLAEWLKESQGEDPETYGIDVQDAVDAVCNDCGMEPDKVSILGVLHPEAEEELNYEFNLDGVKSVGGYPGAPSILKYESPMKTYYFIAMYEGTIVAICNTNRAYRQMLLAGMD